MWTEQDGAAIEPGRVMREDELKIKNTVQLIIITFALISFHPSTATMPPQRTFDSANTTLIENLSFFFHQHTATCDVVIALTQP